ncbi:MAG: ABC transporter ATP-binding protein [Nitrospinota bacterium]|nr:MAG: ABC transporter ATP-binding protein [Nitrospinota bacterium]
MLSVESLHTFYGTSHVLYGVSLQVTQGEVVCLLGRNGAGKSTLLKSIIGLVPPRQGQILFRGRPIAGLPPHLICRQGIGLVPEGRRIFAGLTVRENLEVGRRPEAGRSKEEDYERVFALFPILKQLLHRKAGTLSGGEQQMLAIARTLMGNPVCLLLDEPTSGLAPLVVESLQERIQTLKQNGYTILMAEQHLAFVTSLADRAYVLVKGEIRYQGSMHDLLTAPEVVQNYLSV